MKRLGMVLGQVNKLVEGENLVSLLRGYEKIWGVGHGNTHSFADELADFYCFYKKDYDQAVEAYLYAMKSAQDDQKALSLLNWNVASCLHKGERNEEAPSYRKICWEIECSLYGAQHITTMKTAIKLCKDYMLVQREEEAIKMVDLCLDHENREKNSSKYRDVIQTLHELRQECTKKKSWE